MFRQLFSGLYQLFHFQFTIVLGSQFDFKCFGFNIPINFSCFFYFQLLLTLPLIAP